MLCIVLFSWHQVPFAAASALQILDVEVTKTAPNVISCDFTLNKTPLYRSFGLGGPPRIVIDFDNADMVGHVKSADLTNTPIQRIRTGKHENNSLRVVLDTAYRTNFQVTTSKNGGANKAHLVVTIFTSGENGYNKQTTIPTKVVASKKNSPRKPIATPIVLPATTSSTKTGGTKIAKSLLSPAAISSPVALPVTKSLPLLPATTKTVKEAVGSSSAKLNTFITRARILPLPVFPAAAMVTTMPMKKKSLASSASVTKPASPVLAFDLKSSIALLEPDHKQKPRDIVVVIDPGHGGRDPGASGMGGVKEKDIVLAIAKNLQNYLNNQDGYSAILTRDGDYYVNLHERLHIAHINKADIFLSLHADVYKNSSIKGSSLFALSRSGSTSETARWLAEKENISELGKQARSSNALRLMLLGLAQNVSVKTSLRIGDKILAALNDATKLHTQRIEQADFIVLQSPDIPSLLIETGFISDPVDEQKLKDAFFQQTFAEALAHGVMNYFMQYPPVGTVVATSHHSFLKRL